MLQENKVFFSIIVPVYNTEKYIKECLESILMQTYTDYECIIINDGSTDNSLAICNEFALSDQRFTVLNQKNSGPSVARNYGISTAIGDYVVFMDSDDIFANDSALENLHSLTDGNSQNVIFHSFLFCFSDGNITENYDTVEKKYAIMDIKKLLNIKLYKKNKILLANCSFSIKRLFLLEKKLYFKENIFYEDTHFIPRLLCSLDEVLVNHYCFYGYRRNRFGAITYSKSKKHIFDLISILNDLIALSKAERVSYRKKFYWYFCRNIWLEIFKDLITFEDKDKQKDFYDALNDTSLCILYLFNLKHIFLFFFIKFFGIGNAINLRKVLIGLKRKLPTKH